ncbi:MAG TPA: hypothetical protein VNH82_04195 [Candidatus Dormibacteraeota bacterium]|nr:hypothetical protein [Candidatus Dormibacteraeota bacterium]
MTDPDRQGGSQEPGPEWASYGRAMLHSMAEVLAETPETVHHLLLETADYWLGVGITLGARSPERATRLLHLLEAQDSERIEIEQDARSFAAEVLG